MLSNTNLAANDVLNLNQDEQPALRLKVGIVGAAGYTGVELLRILSLHPSVQIKVVTSRAEQGKLVGSIFPNLRKFVGDLSFSAPDTSELNNCDVVFFATPHAVAHNLVAKLLDNDICVIDLSADFRLKDVNLWQKWYQTTHAAPHLLPKAVYGLVELNRAQIKNAQLIAVPGCYPTATILGLLPLLKNEVAQFKFIADCKSGVTGAGRKASVNALFSEASDNIAAYALRGHRHLPEIKAVLSEAADRAVDLTFVPHLTPMLRGIHATLYATSSRSVNLQQIYEDFYQDEYFVDVLPLGSMPQTKNVRGSNHCQIAVHQQENGQIVVLSVIDNLVKGAAGQAVQNMNVSFGLPENYALRQVPLLP